MTTTQSTVELELDNEGLTYEVFKNKQMLVDFGEDYLYYYTCTTHKYRRQGTTKWYQARDVRQFINTVRAVQKADANIKSIEDQQVALTEQIQRERVYELMKDYLTTLPKHGLTLFKMGENWCFEVEGIDYYIDFEERKYYPHGGNGYRFQDCLSMLETIKLYFWEYKGIEVLPDIELLPLLKTDKAKNMQNRRKPYPNSKSRIESVDNAGVAAPY